MGRQGRFSVVRSFVVVLKQHINEQLGIKTNTCFQEIITPAYPSLAPSSRIGPQSYLRVQRLSLGPHWPSPQKVERSADGIFDDELCKKLRRGKIYEFLSDRITHIMVVVGGGMVSLFFSCHGSARALVMLRGKIRSDENVKP